MTHPAVRITVDELIGMLSKVPDRSLPVLIAADKDANTLVVPNFVAPQDRNDDDVEGPPRYVLVGTDLGPVYLEDLDVDGPYFREVLSK